MIKKGLFVLRRFVYITFLFFILISVGCTTLPEGEAPDGPIVPEPENTDDVIKASEAINYMVVSLVMKCRPIADAGRDKPKVQNDFMFSSKKVDYVQMDVWRKLIKMNMIVPVARASEHPEYRLLSEIKPKGRGAGNKRRYSWKMTFERLSDKKILWEEYIKFVK